MCQLAAGLVGGYDVLLFFSKATTKHDRLAERYEELLEKENYLGSFSRERCRTGYKELIVS
jgi:hypothetical protein